MSILLNMDAALSLAVGLRLGAPVATRANCACGERLDELGDHALSCGRGVGRHARHKEANARIQRALCAAGVSTTLEPVGLDLRSGKRPDRATTLSFSRRRAMAWDATACHTCAPTHVSACAQTAGAAASLAVSQERQIRGTQRPHRVPRDRPRDAWVIWVGGAGLFCRCRLSYQGSRWDRRGSLEAVPPDRS